MARNALSLFLTNFSHELRTPLNHIIGFSHLIDQKLSKGLTDDIDKHAANIRRSGSNLLETLNRIIRFAEIDTGAHDEPELEIFAADDLLQEVVDWATPIAAQHQNDLVLTIEEPIGTMRSDSSFLLTALRQIVENACKHSSGGRVEVIGERLGDDVDARVRIVVSDEGPGMDDALAASLLGGNVSPGDPLCKGGLGVGIPLAQKLLDSVGGTVRAEPSAKGSTFAIDLPVFFKASQGSA